MGIEPRSFSEDLDEKLIALVKEHPPLYGGSRNSHKDKDAKDRFWKMISIKLDRNESDCKTRWRTIRDSYKKIKNKQRVMRQNGETSFPKSKYDSDSLKFLDQSFKEEKTAPSFELANSSKNEENYEGEKISVILEGEVLESNTQNIHDGITNSSNSEENHEREKIPEILGVEVLENIPDEYLNSFLDGGAKINEDAVACKMAIGNVISLKRTNLSTSNLQELSKKKLKLISVDEKMFEKTKNDKSKIILEDFVEKQTPAFSEHAVKTFFESMASTVMQFPPRLIAETRLKVCQVVTEMELKTLKD